MPTVQYPRIFPLGDAALTVEFGSVISEPLNRLAIALSDHVSRRPFDGFIESVPTYASTSIFYDTAAVRKAFPGFPTAFDAVRSLVASGLSKMTVSDDDEAEPIEIPVDFSARAGLDLEHVAVRSGMSVDEVLAIFSAGTYRVFMLGFLPGFSYMGEVDERIAVPRKETPRIEVPKGSVGIAGRQTGVYSLASPGGWQIIGRTDVAMFRPDASETCLVKPGDRVRFVRK